jgi:hypothetical protein
MTRDDHEAAIAYRDDVIRRLEADGAHDIADIYADRPIEDVHRDLQDLPDPYDIVHELSWGTRSLP